MDGVSSSSASGTVSQRLQAELESVVGSLYAAFGAATDEERSLMLTLQRDDHEEFVSRGLRRLGPGYYVLDSSRPWLCYWIVHSLALLGRPVDNDLFDRAVEFLEHCQDPDGGYGGGPGQMAHLATTYAATCTLVTLGGLKALSSIDRRIMCYIEDIAVCYDALAIHHSVRQIRKEEMAFCLRQMCRKKILQFLLRMKDPCGGFRVHDDGEMDMRGLFTALAVAHLLDIMVPELLENVGEHVRSCQTYEGGIGGEPGAEAHGGYTFCGLAALAITNQLHMLNLPSLVNWVAFRQGRVDGGFQGRTNKLVDGCYSFWQGGCFQLLQQHMPHLLAQQTTLAAALHSFPDEVKASSEGHLNTKDPEGRAAEESGFQDRIYKSKAECSSIVSDEVQGAPLGKDCLSCGHNSMDGKDAAGDEASRSTSSTLSSQTYSMDKNNVISAEVEAGEEFHSPTEDNLTKDNSDEDEVEYLDADSKAGHNSAEKLFPMAEVGFRRAPLQAKIVEVVELAGDGQGAPRGDSGSSSSTNGSTLDLGSSWDDNLYGPIYDSQALQAYILLCCQDLDGGLRDKPGKPCDYYHTCYCLSGLAGAQYSTAHRLGAPPPPLGVLGPYGNLLEATHALCNVRLDRYYEAQSYFKQRKL